MLKAKLMRDIITDYTPWFKKNPDALEAYVTRGKIIATGTPSLSFMYQYELNVLAMDFPGSLDDLALPILSWARQHQPDLLFNPERRRDGIDFDADILNDDTIDVLFVIKATERVIVNMVEGKLVIEHLAEPPVYQESLKAWDVLIGGPTDALSLKIKGKVPDVQ
jgi:hypothetical protein